MKISCVIGTEWRDIDVASGKVKRHINNQDLYVGSDNWIVTGAVILTRFGQVSERLSRQELFSRLSTDKGKSTLFYKNGKAKFRITDLDHGTYRQWGDTFQRHRIFAFHKPF